MPQAVKDLATSGVKWSSRASSASTEFETNALAAADKWAKNAQAAMDNYRAGISAANIATRFARGVQQAATANKFARKLAAVGSSRYSTGVQGAAQDWQTGFGPYHSVLQAVALPPRKPRGDAGNYERVKAVGQALNARRIAMLGSS